MLRPCLDCGTPSRGSRCAPHLAEWKAQRTTYKTRGWQRYARDLIAAEPWCHLCGRRPPEVRLVAGHYVPMVRGGREARPICVGCNNREG